ncbi:MAG: GAF domain-containing protein [Planctomycetes bacterium]|nr:GAF domain-containing protein [Planctomycetota bacterium]MBI3843007.1 GAF domain-containing protein [Planctomycetota bacterium]
MASKASGRRPCSSLFERLGGAAAVASLVDALGERLRADHEFAPFFAGVDANGLRRTHVKLFTTTLGGPGRRERAKRNKARPTPIEPRQFGRVVEHLVDALQSLGIRPSLVDEVVESLLPIATQIVDANPVAIDDVACTNGHSRVRGALTMSSLRLNPNPTMRDPGPGPRTVNDEAQVIVRMLDSFVDAVQRAKTITDAARGAIEAVRASFGWPYGSFFVLDRNANALRFSADSGVASAEFRRVTSEAQFREGDGVIGRAWRTRDTVVVDLGESGDCSRTSVARRAGMRFAVCVPVIVGGDVVGTCDFFTLEEPAPSPDRVDALRTAGRVLSAAIDRIRERSDAARIQSMLDAAPMNVIYADPECRIRYMNPASWRTLKNLEAHLPIKVEQMIGHSVDVFHSNPEELRRILSDPNNLPRRAHIKVGPETLDLLVSPIFDRDGNYMGPMVTLDVVTRVDKILDAVRAATAGDLTRDVAVKGDDLVGKIGELLGGFLQNLRGSISTIGTSAEALAGSADQLTAISQQMAANAEQTSVQANVVSAASDEVSKNVGTVAAGSEEMTASITEISKNANDAARVATQAVLVAGTATATVSKLGDSSAEIGKIIKVITSIAQQTNLLALNATIEAARAGDAGKGFAVVANEVKDLAKETAKATEDISQKIDSIQADMRGAVDAIGQISSIIDRINDIQSAIASAVEQQTATTNEIGHNVSEAAEGTAEIARNITGVAQAAQSTSTGASDTQRASVELARMATQLRNLVGQFRC